MEISAGRELFRGAGPGARGGILAEGLTRVYLAAPDGREMTLRYAAPGALVGFLPKGLPDAHIQAIRDCSVLEVQSAVLEEMVNSDHGVAEALIADLNGRLLAIVERLSGQAFERTERRITNALVYLAAIRGVDEAGRSVVPVTQQVLADEVAASREVVNRLLGRLARSGVVGLEPGRIVVLDPEGLRGPTRAAAGWPAGTRA